ncbi:hypothetical protein SLE2022_112340 [Rubroshorea leprosula]
MSNKETDHCGIDSAFMDFYEKYVAFGNVGYMEKLVSNGAKTVAILRKLREMYSLFIIGKGGKENLSITTLLSESEE